MEQSQITRFLAQPDVTPLLRRLCSKSPIQAWIARNRESLEANAAAELLRAFQDTKVSCWADRVLACSLLGELDLTPPERAHACCLLVPPLLLPEGDNQNGRAMRSTFVISSLLAASWMWTTGCFDSIFAPLLYCVCVAILMICTFPLCLACLPMWDWRRNRSVQRAAVRAIAQVGDPNCIVALEYHAYHRPTIRAEARQALRAVLPRVDSNWYGRLPIGCNRALAELAGVAEEEIALAALDALGQAGDGGTAEAVKRLLERTTTLPGVRARAAAVLPILIARKAREADPVTLLRPSHAGAADQLVRPVYGTEPEVTHLLRASQADHTDGP